ncbi:response regulator, partial [Erysipelatoclostridium ramosum]|nr:response regulator [Thomasclavelia ramosa]
MVEDEPTLATAIAQRLTNEGWTARVAGDGATAVKAADKLHPDLIIMDLMLPVIVVIRRTTRTAALPPTPLLRL